MKETALRNAVLMAVSKIGTRLFRNNTGTGWVGKVQKFAANTQTIVGPGDVVIRDARPFHAGLCVGSSDLIGWHPVVVTQEMVGETIAVFTAVELKTGRLKATPEQTNFLAQVTANGGVGVVAYSPDDALGAIRKPATLGGE